MGQSHFRYLNLDEIVGRADLIVVTRPEKPFTTIRTVPVETGKLKAVEPFISTVYHMEVIETLFYAFEDQVPQHLAVESADWQTRLWLYREYHKKGLSRHVVEERYHSSFNLEDMEKVPMILFLFYHSNTAEFVVEGAYESLQKKAEVLRIIKQKQRQRES